MNAMSLHIVFSSLLTRYRQQVTDLDAAADQDDIDRLVNASQDTLTELAGTRPRSAAAMADKVQELIRRYADFGALPMDLVRELLADTYHLASEPGLTLAWVHLWSDIGGWVIDQGPGHRYLGLPEPLQVSDTYTATLPAAFKLANEDEANGAAKTLRAAPHRRSARRRPRFRLLAGEPGMTAVKHSAAAPATASIGPVVKAGSRAEWDEALAAYRTAKTNLDTFDARYINTPEHLPIGPARSAYVDNIPRSVWAESERLAEIMYDAEERLMPIPSPDPIAFAAKFLVARGEGRTADGYDHLLEAEAARLVREAMA